MLKTIVFIAIMKTVKFSFFVLDCFMKCLYLIQLSYNFVVPTAVAHW